MLGVSPFRPLECPEETPSVPNAKGLLDPYSLPCGTTFFAPLPDHRPVPATDRRYHGTLFILGRLIRWTLQLLLLRFFRRRNLSLFGHDVARGFHQFEGYWADLGRFLIKRTNFFHQEVRTGFERYRPTPECMPFDEVKAIVEEDLGSPLKMVFSEFAEEPMRVGPHADSYRARLRRGGAEVIVKVQRPDLERRLTRDLRVFRIVAAFLKRMEMFRHIPWDDMIAIFTEQRPALLDLRYEASSLRRMRKTMKHHKVHIPKLFRDYARKRVLVHEHVDAPTLQELMDYRDADPPGAEGWLLANEIDLEKVAQRLYGSMLRQICEDNLFLDDLGASNILLLRESRLAIASCGHPSTVDKRFLTIFNLALGAMTRNDYEKFADMLFLLCQSLPAANLTRVRADIIRALRSYNARSELQGATHEEKSLFILTAQLARLLVQNDIVLDWQVLKVMGPMGSADESMAALFPQMNYRKELGRYGRKAVRRKLQGVFGQGLMQSAVGLVSPLVETVRFETASMRKRAQNFRATIGKVPYVLSKLFRWLGRLVIVGIIIGVWVFLHQHYYRVVDQFAETEASKMAREVERIDYGWWIAIFIGAIILYRIIHDMARGLAREETPAKQP
jgi:ubiquinone biosynthesis protein